MSSDGSMSRRAVLAGVGVASVAVLGGCARYGPATPDPGSGTAEGSVSSAPDAGGALPTTAVPVGGGVVLGERGVVVTQPNAGQFKAFSAICTHQGCTVAEVRAGTINCPCHGSRFSAADGSVVNGPAARPLKPVPITVAGTNITFG
jgi:Rieske Fe-S protein